MIKNNEKGSMNVVKKKKQNKTHFLFTFFPGLRRRQADAFVPVRERPRAGPHGPHGLKLHQAGQPRKPSRADHHG